MKRRSHMPKDNKIDLEHQSRLLLACVHQARQPLYVIQTVLSAANFVAKRQEMSTDLKLIQQGMAEMRTAVDRLALTISVIAGIARPEARKPVPIQLFDLVREAFVISSFCLRNERGMVNYDLPQTTSGSTPVMKLIDYPTVLIALIRWILGTASCSEFKGETDHPESLRLSAYSDGMDVNIQISSSRSREQVRLGEIIQLTLNSPET